MDTRCGSRTLISTSTSTCATWPCPPRRRPPARRAGHPHRGAPSRPGKAPVGALPHRGPGRRARRHPDQDPPRGHRRCVGSRAPGAPARHRSRRAPRPAPGHAVAGGPGAERTRALRARCALPHPPAHEAAQVRSRRGTRAPAPGLSGLRSDVTVFGLPDPARLPSSAGSSATRRTSPGATCSPLRRAPRRDIVQP